MIHLTLTPEGPTAAPALAAIGPELPTETSGARAELKEGAIHITGHRTVHVRALAHTLLRLLDAADAAVRGGSPADTPADDVGTTPGPATPDRS